MAEQKLYTLKGTSKPPRTDYKDALRVFLSMNSMTQLKLQSGDLCTVRSGDGLDLPALAWLVPGQGSDNTIQASKVFQELHDVNVGDKVSVRRSDEKVQSASTIQVVYCGTETLNEAEYRKWEWSMSDVLYKAEVFSPGMRFENQVRGRKASFVITRVNGITTRNIYRFVKDTSVAIDNGQVRTSDFELRSEGIFGLDTELRWLHYSVRKFIVESGKPTSSLRSKYGYGHILLHGHSGVGKTMILKRVLEIPWKRAFEIDISSTNTLKLEKIFADARNSQPSVVAIDNLELLSPDSESSTPIIQTLARQMEQTNDAKVLVLGAINNVRSLPAPLRRAKAFLNEIEIGMPDTQSRLSILKSIRDVPLDQSNDALEDLAKRNPGCAGSELEATVFYAMQLAEQRLLQSLATPIKATDFEPTPAEWEAALRRARTSSVQIEVPTTHWTDIGGMEKIKQDLREAVEIPLYHPEKLQTMGLRPRKGLLLYGPPGCAKTLLAKAIATEAGMNFLAVKGAELLNMYVGESERQIREVFQRARAASPSILFFDEIDAIGGTREGGHRVSGLNVLTTLLNELDGIEELKGVFILAATNRPEILDPALMRPGRLDQICYAGPPDKASRADILRITLAKMDVEDSLDRAWLAEATDGYSGAETVTICQTAGFAAVDEWIKSGVQGRAGMIHFEQALRTTPKQITAKMLEAYDRWGKKALLH